MGEAQRAKQGLGGVEVVEAEALEAAPFLQFLDPIFEFASKKVVSLDAGGVHLGGGEASHNGLVAVSLEGDKPLARGFSGSGTR